MFGAALIYGDGATPTVSVLSALEVLNIVTSTFHPYILPAAVAVLIALFAIQPLGMACSVERSNGSSTSLLV